MASIVVVSPTNICAPASTAADSIFGLSIFVPLNVDICRGLRVARLRRRQIQQQTGDGSQRARTNLRQKPGRVGLDCDPGSNRASTVPVRSARRCVDSESAATTCCERYRPPVVPIETRFTKDAISSIRPVFAELKSYEAATLGPRRGSGHGRMLGQILLPGASCIGCRGTAP